MVFVEKSTRVPEAVNGRNLGESGFPGLDGVAVRGARAMLGMSQAQLCEAAGCGRNLLNDWENGLKVPGATKIADVRAALEAAGAEFFDEGGRGFAVRVDRSRAAGRTPRGRTIGEGRESETD